MATDVVMPQMGESIAEGTIVRWIKKVGEKVDRDEPLFEISTDKVDAEIPAPAAGTVAEIRVKEGETVPVNSVVAVIRPTGESGAKPGAQSPTVAPVSAATEAGPRPPAELSQGDGASASLPSPSPKPAVAEERHSSHPAETIETRIRQRSSPLVRKIAKDHDIDISQIHGTGISGRVTKRDIQDFI